MSAATDQPQDAPVTAMEAPIYLSYNFTAGHATERFLSQLKQGRLVGQRCPRCRNVYVPPRGSCARCGVATDEEVPLTDKATVESYTVVHIPIPGNPIKPPFVVANLVIDGSNLSCLHLISGCSNDQVRIGMRVQAVWKDASEWGYGMDNISYFGPIDEPDVPRDQIGRMADA